MKRTPVFFLFILVLLASCHSSRQAYDPNRKFTRTQLQSDYTRLRKILETKHPSLYWYTPKDSMDFYFDSLYNNIADSMTELQFGWDVLAPLTQKIHCGHTSFGMSKNWSKFSGTVLIPSFPLHLKIWNDTMVVTVNLNRKDSLIKRGTLITSINGLRNHELIQQMFRYLPMDGYADNVNYVRLSSNFPYYHRNIFGLFKNYRVGYIDEQGKERTALLPMFTPKKDTTPKKVMPVVAKPTKSKRQIRRENRELYRSLQIDTSLNTAILTINTFSRGGGRHLRNFIRRSFRTIRKKEIGNLVIDLRSNGGGDVGISVLLTKFLRNTPFKVADTAYAVTKSLKPFTGNIKNGFFTNLGLFFLTKKHRDGKYHFGYWEKHWYHPKENNHFDGKVYVLINGPTFSASTLFCNSVKGQENVTLVGEEAGGGWHGNSGIMIPDIVLPNTKLRVRLPLFKLVQFNHVPQNGRGVAPDIFIPPTVEGVRKSVDRKMELVKGLIRADQQK